MADAPVLRDRAGELVERGEKSSQQAKTSTPSLASIVAQWQQSIGNSNVAALSALADEQATEVPAPTTGAPAAAPADAAPESPRPGMPTRARTPADVVQADPGATTTSGSAAPAPNEPDEIEMPAMDIAAERAAVAQAPLAPQLDRDVPSAPTGAPRLDESRPDVSSRAGSPAAPPSAVASPTSAVASPSVAGPTAAPAGGDAPAASPAAAARSRVDEFTKPGFTEKNQAAKGKPKLSAGGRPTGSGGRPNRPPQRSGGGGAAAKPSLGDPALDRWKAAVAAGTADVKSDDLTGLADAAADVAKEGTDRTAARQASLADPTIDAKSNQPPLPKEEPKQKALNTAEADSVIAAVEAAGTKRLTDQSFSPIGSPPKYEGAILTGSDYVPKNLRTELAAAALALVTTWDATEQAVLFRKFNKLKEQIATIEATGGKGVGPEAPQAIHDDGPASLTPPNPVMGDVLGDAIARSMLSVDSRATQIHVSAVRAVHGSKVRPMIDMGKAEEPALQRELRAELTGIAAAAGVSKEQLDTKVIEQQAVVFKQILHAETGIQFEAANAVAGRQGQAKDEGDAIAGAKTAVQQEISDKQAAAEGPPDTEAIEAKRDELLDKLTATAATVSAGWRASVTKRHAELDAGASEKQQQITALANTQAAAIRRHWDADTDPNRGMVEARPTVEWAGIEAAKVEAELNRLKTASTAEHDALVDGVNQQLTPGKDQIRDWAARQEGRERGWWERLLDMFRDWGKQAIASNEAWERQRNAESRTSMTQDLDLLAEVKQAQLDRSQGAYSAAMGKLTQEQQLLARTYLEGGIDSIGFVAESTMSRIAARRTPELAATFEQRAIAEWEWEPLGELARATNPEFQPKVLANKVHAGVDGAGTKEAKVYEGLGGARTAVERAALAKCYETTFGDSMAADIKGDMDDEELDRAQALMSGDSAAADAAAIADSVDWFGGDAQVVREALRGKTPAELEAIKKVYREKYGIDLTAHLQIVMHGAERDNVLALADGDIDKADAAELEDAMAGPGTDEAKMKQVLERIREEEQRYALAHSLTKPELDKRIKDRNTRVAAKYAAMGYGNLTANAKDELSDGSALAANNADNKLFDALQAGDESKVDAAKALIEREGAYTSDDEVERIVRNQRTKAEFDVNLEEAGKKARLVALANSGDISKDEYATQLADIDPNDQANQKRKEALIVSKGKANMAALKSDYAAMAGTGGSNAASGTETFDGLIDKGTSGYSKDEINELIDAGGKLSPEQEIYYAVAGAGTDEGKIKETLKGKTPAEIERIRSDYETLHGKGSFNADILGDLSGREDLDVGLTLVYGDPSTFDDQLAKAKPEDRAKLVAGFEGYLRKRQDFERTGGASMPPEEDSMNSLAQIALAITRAKDYHAALTLAEADPENKDKAIDVLGARARFDMNFQGAVQAQEEVREQNDAFADIAAQVAAALVGIAVAFATAGTATLAMVALYAAVASAATSIVVKATLKGAAYGWEDLGIDVAVGLVDIATSYATAGFGKVALAAVERAVLSQAARMAAKEGAGKLTERAVKAFIKEAVEEGIENGIQAMPSAFVSGLAEGQDVLTAAKGAGTAGLQGGGVGIGIHGGKAIVGAAATRIKGALAKEPHIETGSPQRLLDEPRLDEPRLDEPPVGPLDDGHAPTPAPKAIPGGSTETKPLREVPADDWQAAKVGTPDPDASRVRSAEPHQRGEPSGPARERATARGGPSPDDVGKSLSADDLATRYGMPAANVAKIKAIAEDAGVIIDIRPTTPYAEAMLREGTALPKPEKLKPKTISRDDVMLGLATEENLGKVGYFPPESARLPDNFDELEPGMQRRLLDRARQRQAEFTEHQAEMAELVADGKIRLETDGTITNTGLLVGKGELPFTGDHDIFDIRQADGRPVDPKKYGEIVRQLIEADVGVMHGAANNWKLDSKATFNPDAMAKMEANHSANGKEPLVRLGAGEPHAVWHEPYEIPEGTIYFSEGADSLDAELNHDYFKKVAARQPEAEVALLRNRETGQYVVMQGNRHEVLIGDANEMVNAPVNQQVGGPTEGLISGGFWEVVAHNHPVDASGVTPAYNRLPSGANGDMRAVVREATAAGEARTSELHFVTETGPGVAKFGFEPGHELPYMIEVPRADGPPIPKRFATIDDYHDWYAASPHGRVATLGDVPDDFEGPRRQRSQEFNEEEPTVPGRRPPSDGSVRAVEPVDEVGRLQAEQDRAAAADRRGESEFADDDAAVGMDSLDDEAGLEAGGEPGRISQLDTPDPRGSIEQAQAGNDFNRSQRGVYSAEELLLENGKRVDGYTPGLVIVSRKRTQFSEISPLTAEKYVIELLDKYGPGNLVADKPYNRVHYPQLVGQPLDGQLVLEVSVQHTPIPEELGSLARRWGVVIRDFNGTMLN